MKNIKETDKKHAPMIWAREYTMKDKQNKHMK